MEMFLQAYFLDLVPVEAKHSAFHTRKALFTHSRCHSHHVITQVDQMYRDALEITLGKSKRMTIIGIYLTFTLENFQYNDI